MHTSLALKTDISGLKNELENRTGELNERLVGLIQRLEGFATKLEEAATAAAAQGGNVTETLNTMNASLVTYINGLMTAAVSRDSVQDLIELSNKNIIEMLHTMNSDVVSYIEKRIGELDARIAARPARDEVQTLIENSDKNVTQILNTMNDDMISYVENRVGKLADRMAAAPSRDEMQHLLESSSTNLTGMLNSMNGQVVSYVDKRIAQVEGRIKLPAGTALDGGVAGSATEDGVDRLLALIGLARRDANVAAYTQAAQNENVTELLNTMNANLVGYVEKRLGELAEECYELIMQARGTARAAVAGAVRDAAADGATSAPVRKSNVSTVESVFQSLAQRAPAAWPIFEAALDTGTRSYEGFPIGSCSVDGHLQAERFGAFIAPYLRGYVLDVGCGPQPVPSYLRDYPVDLICGIDPISTADDHPFEFVNAIAEEIPWRDGSFEVVCSGTTLDHFFLLDVALREIYRVLKPGGHFVAWISEAPGSERYDPYRENVVAADEEHLFHIDRAWFLPMMRDLGFQEAEILAFSVPFDYLFMSFRKPTG